MKILNLGSRDISQKLRQTKCILFKIWRLKFTIIPKKPFCTSQFGKICVLVNFIIQKLKSKHLVSEIYHVIQDLGFSFQWKKLDSLASLAFDSNIELLSSLSVSTFFSYFRIFLFLYQILKSYLFLSLTFPISLSAFTSELLSKNLTTKYEKLMTKKIWFKNLITKYIRKLRYGMS